MFGSVLLAYIREVSRIKILITPHPLARVGFFFVDFFLDLWNIYSMKSIVKTQKILGIDTNPKTVKGMAQGFMTGIVYLAPSDESGVANTCPHASKGCRAACLFTAGRGSMNNVRNPRIKKTISFFADKASWINQLKGEISNAKKKASRNEAQFVVRLNGTSDIAWENENIFQTEKETQFTTTQKILKECLIFLMARCPPITI